MSRFYTDSYLHRYTEAQIENNHLRREILELKDQIQSMKFYNGDLKTENTREKLRHAEQSRFLSSRLNELELTLSDLRTDNYLTKKEAQLKVKQLNEEKALAASRAEQLEWLNQQLRDEKNRHLRLSSELEYKLQKQATELSSTRLALDRERSRNDSLYSLNSSLNSENLRKSLELKDTQRKLISTEVDNTRLSIEIQNKRDELKASSDRIQLLREDRNRLLHEVSETKEELNRTRSRLDQTLTSNEILQTSLEREKREKESYRQSSFELTQNNLEMERLNADYARKLKNHEKMFEEVYNESRNQLEKIVRLAERNLDISRQDASRSFQEASVDEVPLNNLNSSNAFTEYHEKQLKKNHLEDSHARDLRMHRLESTLSDSLDRLRRWKNSSF